MNPDAIEIPITTDTSKFARETARATKALFDLEVATKAYNAASELAAKTWDRFVKSQIDAIRQIDRLAGSSLISTRTIAGLRIAAQQLGQDLDALVPVDLADRLQELRDGTTSYTEDFALLGLTARDFEAINYDLDKSFALIVSRLATVEDKTKAAGAASRLMSTQGENLFAVFGDGAQTLEDYAAAAAEIGAATPEATAATRELTESLGALSLATDEAGAALVRVADELGLDEGIGYFARGAAFAIGALEDSFDRLRERLNGTYVGLNLITLGLYGVLDAATNGWGAALDDGRQRLDAFDRAVNQSQGFRVVGEQAESAVFAFDAIPDSLRAVDAAAKGASTSVETLRKALRPPDEGQAASIFGADMGAAIALQLAAERGAAALRGEMAQDALDAELRRLEELGDARAKATAQAIREAERLRDAQRAGAIASVGYAQDGIQAIASLAQGTSSEVRGLLTAAAVAERAAAAARTLFQVGPAYAQGVGSAPPPLGPILGGINAGAVIAAAAATLAQPLPRYHTGRAAPAPDETTAVLRRDESVLTGTATREVLAALNAGRTQPGAQSIVVLGHEAVGRAATTALQDPGSHLRRAIERGDLPGRTRRRR